MATITELTPGVRPHPGDPRWRAVRAAVLDRDGWLCQCCGKALVPVTDPKVDLTGDSACVDHIVPILRGGWHTPENLQALCVRCNISKGNEVIDYRGDLVAAAELATQIAERGIDVDTPTRYTKRQPGRERRTDQLRIAVTPAEKAWITATFGTHRALVDILAEVVDDPAPQVAGS